jgi:hypothetical protein
MSMKSSICMVQKSTRPPYKSRQFLEFARSAGADKLFSMKLTARNSAKPLSAKMHQLFSRDLALENDFLRQENRILRSKFSSRVPLTEADRPVLVQ